MNNILKLSSALETLKSYYAGKKFCIVDFTVTGDRAVANVQLEDKTVTNTFSFNGNKVVEVTG